MVRSTYSQLDSINVGSILVPSYVYAKGRHESSVHRNPYEGHDAYDAIRTQDADLAVRKLLFKKQSEQFIYLIEIQLTRQ